MPYPIATDKLRLSVWKANSKRAILELSGTRSLKRPLARLSEQSISSEACCKRFDSVQTSCLLELARLSELPSIKRAA